MMKTKFCVCSCFFTKNLFLRQYDLHVTYDNKKQFLQEFSETLASAGCVDPESMVEELESEKARRMMLHEQSWERRMQIAREYKPLHPHLFTLQESFLDKKFLDLVNYAKSPNTTADDLIKKIKPHQRRIYSFPVMTKEFCQKFVEELENFEASPLPKGRPNTMNRYGTKLDELGFDDFITSMITEYMMPITKLLYPDWGGDSLDSHKAFIVKYEKEEGKDADLNYHFDNAEVTLNVSLNEGYMDGEVYYGPMRNEESAPYLGVGHTLGTGLLHRSQQKHGALPVSEGVRYNLIIWMRSSAVRNQLCPMCDEKPKMVAVDHGYGDGFTCTEVDLCSAS